MYLFSVSKAYTVHKDKGKAMMRLTGIAIADSFCDALTMPNHADSLDNKQTTHFQTEHYKVKNFIEQEDCVQDLRSASFKRQTSKWN